MGGGGGLETLCIKIVYSDPSGVKSREESASLAESSRVLSGGVMLDSDWLTKCRSFFVLHSDWLTTTFWFLATLDSKVLRYEMVKGNVLLSATGFRHV